MSAPNRILSRLPALNYIIAHDDGWANGYLLTDPQRFDGAFPLNYTEPHAGKALFPKRAASRPGSLSLLLKVQLPRQRSLSVARPPRHRRPRPLQVAAFLSLRVWRSCMLAWHSLQGAAHAADAAAGSSPATSARATVPSASARQHTGAACVRSCSRDARLMRADVFTAGRVPAAAASDGRCASSAQREAEANAKDEAKANGEAKAEAYGEAEAEADG